MKICTILILVCYCLVAAQTQYNQDLQGKKPSFGVYAAEFGGAFSGTVCCGGIGCGLSALALSWALADAFGNIFGGQGSGVSSENQTTVALAAIAAIALIPVSAAFGTDQVGKRMGQRGNAVISGIGAVCGSALGLGIGYGISRINPDRISWIMIPTTLLGNSIGAVIGYNLSRPKLSKQNGFFYDHLQMPSLGLRLEKDNQRKTITALDLKLINARF